MSSSVNKKYVRLWPYNLMHAPCALFSRPKLLSLSFTSLHSVDRLAVPPLWNKSPISHHMICVNSDASIRGQNRLYTHEVDRNRKTRCRVMLVWNFPKCETGRRSSIFILKSRPHWRRSRSQQKVAVAGRVITYTACQCHSYSSS